MRKLLFLSIAFAPIALVGACSAGDTKPPPLGDCPTCRGGVFVGGGQHDGGDATLSETSADVGIDNANKDALTDATDGPLLDVTIDVPVLDVTIDVPVLDTGGGG